MTPVTGPGRNDPCPCGSGRKWKKCCQDKLVPSFSRTDRSIAIAALTRFVGGEFRDDLLAAHRVFWGELADRAEELDELDDLDGGLKIASDQAFDFWFAFDHPVKDGLSPVDCFLEDCEIPAGGRAFLEMMRGTTMRLYEVVDAVPGVSITLRDVMEGDRVTVHEQSGSRFISRFDLVAARVAPRGASGQPEIEAGFLQFPPLLNASVTRQLAAHRAGHFEERPRADVFSFYKEMAPFFHGAWANAVLDPVVPEIRNTDDEPLLMTRVHFEVGDAPALSAALDDCAGLTRDGTGATEWSWSGDNARGASVSLGRLVLDGNGLLIESNSAARGERGRLLVEGLGAGGTRHRSTTHEDLTMRIREGIRAERRGTPGPARPGATEIPRDVAEQLSQNHYARHYRAWLDEPVPLLDGRTPREAASDPARRGALVDILHQLERMYQESLRSDIPAFDPSWMWSELGLEDRAAPAHPPPLAHERVAELVPGSGPLCHALAEQRRREPGSEGNLRSSLDVQRLLREESAPAAVVLEWLRLVTDFELHRRKAFWVDEALSFMLHHTELDVVGRELRVPFPSFALVFTDRHVLSLAERLVARDAGSPLRGQLLRVLTVYVAETQDGEARTLEVSFAPDALGADLPGLLRHDIPLSDDVAVQDWLDRVAPRPAIEPLPPDTDPLRGLARIVLNAILYATSAGVEAAVRAAPATSSRASTPPRKVSSESVYFLPGTIEISHLRRMQALERIPDGREVLRRFMVRGHWRRAAPNWVDRSLRWIAPHWKGPDLAAIIERTYKLKP